MTDAVKILFEKALQLDHPWQISIVEFVEKDKLLNIYLDFPKGSEFKCPKCGSTVKAYDTEPKKWKHLNFFQYECYIHARVPRIKCNNDGITQVLLPWARERSDLTLLFEAFAMTLCREMPTNKVAQIIKVDDEKLWRMQYHYVEESRKLEDYSEVDSIGVDETSMRKGHDYITLVVDLKKKKTIYVTPGKDAETIKAFWKDFIEHKGIPENIGSASIDMSPAFIKGMQDHFPNAQIIFDKFHIMKIINKAVDGVRREEYKEQEILRDTKYIWLKNRNNLTKDQKERLTQIESMPDLNLKTIRAMHIRENFQEIYKEETKKEFETSLKKWFFWATHSKIEQMIEAAATIKNHWDGIISWFQNKINNGILEGLNSLIQAAKSKARGYKTFKNLMTMVYMLTGKLNFEALDFTHTK